MTPRAVETLRIVDFILAEDTRHSRKLLNHYGLRTPLLSCHRFNEAARVDMVLQRLAEGRQAAALISNAGMPAISDPGARLVAACHDHGVPVYVVPGPSSVSAAVALSGFGGRGFVFEGFLPHKSGARKKRLQALAEIGMVIVLFESPFRITRLLGELRDTVGTRQVFLAREMTKHYEEALRATAAELLQVMEGRHPKGEFVVVVEAAPRASVSGRAIDRSVSE